LSSATGGNEIRVIEAHTAAVNGIVYDPQGAWVATASDDGTVIVSETATGNAAEILSDHTAAVRALSLARNAPRLLTASADGTARLWSIEDWRHLASVELGAPIDAAALASDAGWAVLGGAFGLRVWTPRQPEIAEPLKSMGTVTAVAVSADGKIAAASTDDGRLRLWSVRRWQLLWTSTYETVVTALAFSSAGNLSAACADGAVWLVELGPLYEHFVAKKAL
jgi:WD40 repeat protein